MFRDNFGRRKPMVMAIFFYRNDLNYMSVPMRSNKVKRSTFEISIYFIKNVFDQLCFRIPMMWFVLVYDVQNRPKLRLKFMTS